MNISPCPICGSKCRMEVDRWREEVSAWIECTGDLGIEVPPPYKATCGYESTILTFVIARADEDNNDYETQVERATEAVAKMHNAIRIVNNA